MGRFKLSKYKKEKLSASIQKARNVPAPENSLGQWIGYSIDEGTSSVLEEICSILSNLKQKIDSGPKEGESRIQLYNTLGQSKQIDHVVKVNNIIKLLVESKWLKDKRHLNDKGSWVLMMSDILLQNPQIEGIVVVLAGPWDGMRTVIEKRAKVVIIPLDEVYKVLNKYGIQIIIEPTRNAYENAEATLKTLLDVVENGLKKDYDIVKEIGYEMVNIKKNELLRYVKSYL